MAVKWLCEPANRLWVWLGLARGKIAARIPVCKVTNLETEYDHSHHVPTSAKSRPPGAV